MDLFRPKGFASVRRPTDNNQNNGRVINAPRFSEYGGLGSAKKLHQGSESSSVYVAKPGDGKKVI
jgi:hypothetical protein